MALDIGKVNELQVLRKTDIAYILKSKSNDEVFLHVNETDHRTLSPGSYVDAFLYYDAKGRLAATLQTPLITAGSPGLLKVVSVKPGLGVFLDLGISKDVLLSKDDIGEDESIWPEIGEELLVDLRVKAKLTARPIPYNELRVIIGNLEIGDEVEGFIQVVGKIGYFILTKESNVVLVKQANSRGNHRLGERVKVKITYETKNGYEGNLSGFKEVVRVDDSKAILDYLTNNQNVMPYTAETDSETIKAVFDLSRKAFKRALGLLYKQRKVEFRDGKTYLVNNNE